VKVGVTLPQFRDDADAAIAAARRAEELGLDGVFCFDHLWPIGQPGRPAVSSGPLLGAVAASTSTIHIGTFVARIGLLPDDVLVEMLVGLNAISGGRLIAGLGTGDKLSQAENQAFGLPFEPAEERRVRLASVAVAVQARGIKVWVGGGLPSTSQLAQTVGGAVNLWEADVLRVAEMTAAGFETTWGGPVEGDAAQVEARLQELAEAGATWAVCAWPDSLEIVAEAAEALR
jgi:alkanesulfonate monooxygenase SsuD/methylene tetrahydromethanopterin reductase-like flavin-dependent oxidoreductase (luciferase family)